jgi:transitional endoplasmic reticulum ATPase
VGASEKAVAAAFAAARAAAPALLFLDELDALAPARDAQRGGSGAVPRVVAQLLQELDGGAAQVGQPGSLLLLAATNRPDLVDAALLRPGRLDRLCYVPPPAGEQQLLACLHARLRGTPLEADAVAALPALAARCTGFTGADCGALVREAQLAALAEELAGGREGGVAARHLEAARALVRASPPVSPHMARVYASLGRG